MVLIKAIADDIEGAGMHVIEVRRLGMIFHPAKLLHFLRLSKFFRRKSHQQPLHPTLYTLHRQLRCPLNQYSPYKKRRSPALNHFALGCQRRVALPTQTKDYPRIVMN